MYIQHQDSKRYVGTRKLATETHWKKQSKKTIQLYTVKQHADSHTWFGEVTGWREGNIESLLQLWYHVHSLEGRTPIHLKHSLWVILHRVVCHLVTSRDLVYHAWGEGTEHKTRSTIRGRCIWTARINQCLPKNKASFCNRIGSERDKHMVMYRWCHEAVSAPNNVIIMSAQ